MRRPRLQPLSRGFTLIEMMVVVVMIGIMLSVALPYLRDSSTKGSVRGAVDALVTMHAIAKTAAVQRARTTRLIMSGQSGNLVVVSTKIGLPGVDTLGRVENLNSRFGVSFATNRDTLTFSPRGVGVDQVTTTIVIRKGDVVDTVTVSPGGRLTR